MPKTGQFESHEEIAKLMAENPKGNASGPSNDHYNAANYSYTEHAKKYEYPMPCGRTFESVTPVEKSEEDGLYWFPCRRCSTDNSIGYHFFSDADLPEPISGRLNVSTPVEEWEEMWERDGAEIIAYGEKQDEKLREKMYSRMDRERATAAREAYKPGVPDGEPRRSDGKRVGAKKVSLDYDAAMVNDRVAAHLRDSMGESALEDIAKVHGVSLRTVERISSKLHLKLPKGVNVGR